MWDAHFKIKRWSPQVSASDSRAALWLSACTHCDLGFIVKDRWTPPQPVWLIRQVRLQPQPGLSVIDCSIRQHRWAVQVLQWLAKTGDVIRRMLGHLKFQCSTVSTKEEECSAFSGRPLLLLQMSLVSLLTVANRSSPPRLQLTSHPDASAWHANCRSASQRSDWQKHLHATWLDVLEETQNTDSRTTRYCSAPHSTTLCTAVLTEVTCPTHWHMTIHTPTNKGAGLNLKPQLISANVTVTEWVWQHASGCEPQQKLKC